MPALPATSAIVAEWYPLRANVAIALSTTFARRASAVESIRSSVIGSQGRSARVGLFPHPPFNPCVRFSRTRLTDDLLDMVTQPSDSERCREAGRDLARETSRSSIGQPVRLVGSGPAS